MNNQIKSDFFEEVSELIESIGLKTLLIFPMISKSGPEYIDIYVDLDNMPDIREQLDTLCYINGWIFRNHAIHVNIAKYQIHRYTNSSSF